MSNDRVASPPSASAVTGDTLLVGAEDGTIVTVDSATGQEVSSGRDDRHGRDHRVGSPVADGVTVAVGRNSIELYDAAGNRRGAPIDIPAADEARVRPDGTVVVVPSADTDSLQIVDPNRGPLVERGWDVNSDALVGFGAGRAAVVDRSASTEVIDLTSGERSSSPFATPSGDPFVAVGITPEVDGYLAWNDGTPWPGGEATNSSSTARTLDRRAERQPDRRVARRAGTPVSFDPATSPGDAGGGFAGAGAIAVYEDASRRRRCTRSTRNRATSRCSR